MGHSVTHRCDGCGYEALVSGHGDAGMLVETDTVSCGRCRSIVDVVIRWHDRARYATPPNCPECGAHAAHLTTWVSGGPCPRCGDRMPEAADGIEVLWD